MQIHELPSASPSASDYIPIDNGTATRKATLSSIDMGSNEITFTSGDTSSPSSWQTVAVMASNTAANLMNAISKMVANIRWLYNRLGTSSTGTTATTVTGAIAEHSTKIGNAEMGTTATTLTGAIAEVNDSVNDNAEAISELNSNLSDSGNGYVRMIDGTLIQYGRLTNVTGNNYSFIYPIAFLSGTVPAILFSPTYNEATTARCIFTIGAASNISASISAWDTSTQARSTQTNLDCRYILIGRWK